MQKMEQLLEESLRFEVESALHLMDQPQGRGFPRIGASKLNDGAGKPTGSAAEAQQKEVARPRQHFSSIH